MKRPQNEEHRITWTFAGVLRHTAVWGPIQSDDIYVATFEARIKLCEQLVGEGLLRMTGHATYSITDKGREWLIWGPRGFADSL